MDFSDKRVLLSKIKSARANTIMPEFFSGLTTDELKFIGSELNADIIPKIKRDAFPYLYPYMSQETLAIIARMLSENSSRKNYMTLNKYLSRHNTWRVIDTEDFSVMLEELVRDDSVGIITIFIENPDYMNLLSNKLVPAMRRMPLIEELKAIYDNVPENVFEYWNEHSYSRNLSACKLWSVVTESFARDYLDTYTIAFCHPQLLYSSMRKKTTMSMFITPFSSFSHKHGKQEKYSFVDTFREGTYDIKNALVHVTRYSSSVDTGLYHPEKSNVQVCGTFFYVEPESTTYIMGDNILVAETKCSACIHLIGMRHDNNLSTLIDNFLSDDDNYRWEKGHYRKDLMYSPEEALDELGINKYNYGDGEGVRKLGSHRVYIQKETVLYSAEDIFDQPLCTLASELGYDLVVLTRMVGNEQIVTELLDTRPRDVCMSKLNFSY